MDVEAYDRAHDLTRRDIHRGRVGVALQSRTDRAERVLGHEHRFRCVPGIAQEQRDHEPALGHEQLVAPLQVGIAYIPVRRDPRILDIRDGNDLHPLERFRKGMTRKCAR